MVDAPASGAGDRKVVGVRVPSWAPNTPTKTYMGTKALFTIGKHSKRPKKNRPNELTPKSWTSSPTKGVLFYEQIQYGVQAPGS